MGTTISKSTAHRYHHGRVAGIAHTRQRIAWLFGVPNRIGIKNPAVDAMIDQIVFAKNRVDLEAAARALDRILLWNHYVVPQWYYNVVPQWYYNQVRTARWDRFGHPDLMPKYGKAAFPTVWWSGVQKAAKAG